MYCTFYGHLWYLFLRRLVNHVFSFDEFNDCLLHRNELDQVVPSAYIINEK